MYSRAPFVCEIEIDDLLGVASLPGLPHLVDMGIAMEDGRMACLHINDGFSS